MADPKPSMFCELINHKHVAAVLIYLYKNGPSALNSIYTDVCGSPNTRTKLDILAAHGIINIKKDGMPFSSTMISLTDNGEQIARLLKIADDYVTGMSE